MSPAPAPRVLPWALFGAAVGLLATVAVLVLVWFPVEGATQPSGAVIAATLAVPLPFGALAGAGFGAYLRVTDVGNAWVPDELTNELFTPPSPNGHQRRGGDTVRRGAVAAGVGLALAVFAGPVIPVQPAATVLGVGALATDGRTWVRTLGASALFLSLAVTVGIPLDAVWGGERTGLALAVGAVAGGAVSWAAVRWVRPSR